MWGPPVSAAPLPPFISTGKASSLSLSLLAPVRSLAGQNTPGEVPDRGGGGTTATNVPSRVRSGLQHRVGMLDDRQRRAAARVAAAHRGPSNSPAAFLTARIQSCLGGTIWEARLWGIRENVVGLLGIWSSNGAGGGGPVAPRQGRGRIHAPGQRARPAPYPAQSTKEDAGTETTQLPPPPKHAQAPAGDSAAAAAATTTEACAGAGGWRAAASRAEETKVWRWLVARSQADSGSRS